jgi:hypothetical protein
MKKVAATNGHRVSLADFLERTEVRAADSAIEGPPVGAFATANFCGCLLANKYESAQRLALLKIVFQEYGLCAIR